MPEGFRIAKAFVSVTPDTTGFKDDLKSKVSEATAGVEASVKATLDTSDLDAKADAAKARVDDLGKAHAEASAGLDDSDLSAKADDAKAKLDDLGAKRPEPSLGLDKGDFDGKSDDAKEKLDRFREEESRAKLGLDTAEFDAKLDEAKAKLEAFRTESASVRLGASGGASGGAGGEGGSGFLGMSPMTMGIGASLLGLLPGIGGAAAGAGLLAGTGVLAFGGIGKALSDAHSASQNTGQTSQQLAATEFQNSVQIQQAQQQIGQAHQQAAQDATQAAESIESAQMNLASVERNAAASQVQALQQVQQAQQGVEESNYQLREAEYSLGQAYVQAREQIVSLNDALADSKLNTQAAQLAVQEAEQQQQQVDANAMSTSLQKQQAALAVAQAQQQVTDAQDQQTAAQQAATQANQQGVDGSQTVIQAQQALTQAQYAQKNATEQLIDAQKNLVNTEKNNATQIKQAQLQVAEAEQQAAYTQKRDAQAIEQAIRNLADTYKEQQLQAAATASASSQAANQYKKDLASLTPAGRAVVQQILGMKGALKELETTAQNGVLPGFSKWLTGVKGLLPTINSGVSKMAGFLGGMFAQFGKIMQSKAFEKTLQGLISNGMQFVQIVVPAFTAFLGQLAELGSAKGAVSGLAGLLAGIAVGFTNIVSALKPSIGPLGLFFSTLGKALGPVGTLLGKVIGGLATGLAPLLKALLPGFSALANALGTGLATALSALGPVLAPVGKAISAIAIAAAPLLPILGKLIAQVAINLAPILAGLVPIVSTLAQALGQGLASVLGTLLNAITQLLPPVSHLITGLLPIIGVVADVISIFAKLVGIISGPIIRVLVDILRPLADVVTAIVTLGGHWGTVFNGIKKVALDVYHNAIQPVFSGIASGATTFVSELGTIWGKLEPIFKKPVNFLISTVYDKGIAALWNDVVTHIGLSAIKLPVIPALAGGGIVPGRDQGRDTQLVRMRPEEGVLVPEAVRGIGGPAAIHALNRQFSRGGVTGMKGGLPAFGGGGVLGGIGSVLGSIGSGIGHVVGSVVGGAIDLGKILAAIATGNTTAFVNAAASMIGTPAAGDLAKIMVGIPKTLVTDLAAKLAGSVTGGGKKLPAGSSSAVGSLPQNYQAIASFLASHGFSKFASAGVAGNVDAESGGDPEALEIGGGGGGGLIQWTPYPAGYITGNRAADLMTQLNAILSWGGGPSLVNRATSPSNAAQIYQDYYERPADLTASLPQRMASANAVYKAMGWGSFDQGGWMTGPPNFTGRPEAVLTPQESAAFVAIARHLTQRGIGAGAPAATGTGGRPPVNINYYGTQWPTPEQQAIMNRSLALAIGGATG